MIHPLTNIHPEAKIAPNVEIGPFVTIDKNVEIGTGTKIFSNVTVFEGARIGKNCQLFPGAVISAIPQDLKFKGEDTTVQIGDNNIIRECATIHRGTASKGITIIGNNCLIMAYSHIAHDCVLGNHIILGNATQLAGEVHIDDWAVLAGSVLVHQFCSIGSHVMVQGGTRFSKDIPPFIIVGREPASYGGLNIVGLRRKNFSPEQIDVIHQAYRFIYQSGLNNTDALQKIEEELPATRERDMILSFVKNSERGIIKGYKE
ncbi:MAG: acyl-ACP--UDP-N-acetylglucosamine O-acyltransferase [Candidatus Azobacteroides sp.]|jgi:UDP-N-acetylglucosamine acyltransferase|nr:acyl-ACP--UDP-N-acetylglucosamine O-acyltransferase [Candidatus Azobacteroides sp.]